MRKTILLVILLIDFSKQANPAVGKSSITFVFYVTAVVKLMDIDEQNVYTKLSAYKSWIKTIIG